MATPVPSPSFLGAPVLSDSEIDHVVLDSAKGWAVEDFRSCIHEGMREISAESTAEQHIQRLTTPASNTARALVLPTSSSSSERGPKKQTLLDLLRTRKQLRRSLKTYQALYGGFLTAQVAACVLIAVLYRPGGDSPTPEQEMQKKQTLGLVVTAVASIATGAGGGLVLLPRLTKTNSAELDDPSRFAEINSEFLTFPDPLNAKVKADFMGGWLKRLRERRGGEVKEYRLCSLGDDFHFSPREEEDIITSTYYSFNTENEDPRTRFYFKNFPS